MPKTICSDYSHHNFSLSNSQERITVHRKKKIDKKRGRTMRYPSKSSPHRKNIIVARKSTRKLVYSPEYIISINEVNTPLYYSDEYEPSFDANEIRLDEATKIG
jgi:hypothetical protein